MNNSDDLIYLSNDIDIYRDLWDVFPIGYVF